MKQKTLLLALRTLAPRESHAVGSPDPLPDRPFHVLSTYFQRTFRPTHHYYKVPPAAGINASISDMREWLLAQLGLKPEVLEAKMLETMHQGVIRTSRHQAHYPHRKALGAIYYGLGWRVFDYGNEAGFVHHGGYVKGMRSEMVFDPASQTGMVFLTNSEPGGMNDLVFDFLDTRKQIVDARRRSTSLVDGDPQVGGD